jgi:heat-inducible transcriptional repressor
MEALTDRQELILSLVVREYVESAQMVSSKHLGRRYKLNISDATIRNELNALQDRGYLRQAHTSAGRVPTEAGYRYFVQRLLGENDLPLEELHMIGHQFHQAPLAPEQWMQLAAAVLARTAQSASLVTAPHATRSHFKHLELIATHGRVVLLVLVLQSGEVRQQMLTLAELAGQETLTSAANVINRLAEGLPADAITAHIHGLPALETEVLQLVVDILQRSDAHHADMVYRDGLSNVLTAPEFADGEQARDALRVLEEHHLLEEVLGEALSPDVGGVQVLIGGEGRWEALRQCSVVLSRYGVPDQATGAIGVIGPTRMAYGRAISAVRYVAGLLSGLVYEMYSE